jgi:CRISPR-associated protein Cas2
MLVCYDIPDNHRRSHVVKILKGYGRRVQKSVFECDLTSNQMQKLKDRILKSIHMSEDSLRYYPLCGNCITKIEVINGPDLEKNQSFFIV